MTPAQEPPALQWDARLARVAACHRILHNDNPNETPMPAVPVAKPVYGNSESMVRSGGREWMRTGVCIHCNAAIYMAINYRCHPIPDLPLHHAVPQNDQPTTTQQ